MEQEQEAPTVVPTEDQEEQVQPTKSVKNFWERLDEVFTQNTELRQRMQELVEQFPTEEKPSGPFRSFIFQPDRVSLCSNDDTIRTGNSSSGADQSGFYVPSSSAGHAPGEQFNQFRIRLKRPLRNVKSIQLLSAVIPNAIQNIPDENTFFLYYKLRSVAQAYQGEWSSLQNYFAGDLVTRLGTDYALVQVPQSTNEPPELNPTHWVPFTPPADLTRPNYYDLQLTRIRYLYFTPTFSYTPDQTVPQNLNLFNRTFEDPDDLIAALNFVASQAALNSGDFFQQSIANDVSFQYNDQTKKVQFIPNPNEININQNYYLPLGYEDPNVKLFFDNLFVNIYNGTAVEIDTWKPTSSFSTLNYKLGFTWNGIFQNPATNNGMNP